MDCITCGTPMNLVASGTVCCPQCGRVLKRCSDGSLEIRQPPTGHPVKARSKTVPVNCDLCHSKMVLAAKRTLYCPECGWVWKEFQDGTVLTRQPPTRGEEQRQALLEAIGA